MTENFDRFKFRIWDLFLNEYRTCENSSPADRFVNIDNGMATHGTDFEVSETEDKGAILEQCTGMKDKNDKLIYENDIVYYNEEAYVVIWFDCGWQLYKYSNVTFTALYSELAKHTEVIGNKHQQLK